MKTRFSIIIAAATLISAGAFAEDNIPGHPRVNEVNQRIERQEHRIEAGEASGRITEKQAARDERFLEHKEQRLSKDEAKHNGHITRAEQRRLNKGLNKNSHRIHRQRKH